MSDYKVTFDYRKGMTYTPLDYPQVCPGCGKEWVAHGFEGTGRGFSPPPGRMWYSARCFLNDEPGHRFKVGGVGLVSKPRD